MVKRSHLISLKKDLAVFIFSIKYTLNVLFFIIFLYKVNFIVHFIQ